MKVGDYVRVENDSLNYQFICKIKKIISDDFFFTDIGYWDKENIIKSSPRIIDLIQSGDYVNDYKVYEIKEFCILVGYKCFPTKFDDEEEFLYQTIYEQDIKSIVTKEQFESMQYEVK